MDSVLVADVPAFEAEPFVAAARAEGIAPVMIAAPNTPPATLQRIAELGQGYTYCVARSGVTGTERGMTLEHDALFANLAAYGAPPPILGFGISSPDHVRTALASGAPASSPDRRSSAWSSRTIQPPRSRPSSRR